MPQVKNDVPELLRPLLFHGLDLSWDARVAKGDCPWCGREGKFEVNLETGLWRCWVCAEGTEKGGGNALTFLRLLHEAADRATTDYRDLAEDRGLLPDTLVHWGLARSPLTGDWLVPAYDVSGSLRQLYRYVQGSDRPRLLPTPTLGHHLHGVSLVHERAETLYVCEGPWDAMALWEALGTCKASGDGLASTASPERSLLASSAVVAVPGCSTFFDAWLPLFEGRRTVLMYDNDHRHLNPKTGGQTLPGAWLGMRRAAGMLVGVASDVQFLWWGNRNKADYDPSLPSGYDVRDVLSDDRGPAALERLLSLVSDLPEGWVKVIRKRPARSVDGTMSPMPCERYSDLINSWRKAMRWTDGLDHALVCMLATVASTPMVGDQLWLKVVGPAACGKSTLCEAISVTHKYVLAKSTIRGFHSGFKEQGGSKTGEDNSLLALLPGKTLVTKDGDTLLQSPNLPQILSEGRDVYDGVSRTHYRNAMSKDYDGLRVTWILCGTSSLRQIDSSELGERFLDCVIMEGIDDDLEDEILDRVVHRASRDVAVESDGEASRHYPKELAEAMRLTGGYVEWLREHAADGLAGVDYPEQSRRMLTRLGKFVAHMRARPSLRQEEVAEREFATRLVSQLTRMAGCLALVLNRTTVDDEVMVRVRRVAMDTSRGLTLSLVGHLHDRRPEGLSTGSVAMLAGQTEDKARWLLKFLRDIHAVEFYEPPSVKGVKSRMRWRLTPRMLRLYEEVVEA